MRKYTLAILSAVLFLTISAQDKSIPFEKGIFKDRKDEFKEIKKVLEEADLKYEMGPVFYKQCIDPINSTSFDQFILSIGCISAKRHPNIAPRI